MHDQAEPDPAGSPPPFTTGAARRRARTFAVVICLAAGVLLALLSRVEFVAFHLVAEVAVVVVLGTMFTLAWRTNRLTTNGYLTVMGMAALPIAVVTVLHALTYRGMPALPGHTVDTPTQLWLVARYLTAAAYLVAAGFVARRLVRPGLTLALFTLAAAAAVAAIFSGVFPAAFVAGSGLTPFKIASEYVIIGLFGLGLALLWSRRAGIATSIYRLLAGSIFSAIVAELLFTTYTDPYGITNMLGHLAYLLSFYLLYLALVDASLSRPYEALFGELAAREQTLRKAHRFSEGLNEIDAAIHSTLVVEEILQRVVTKATSIIGADAAVLGLFEGDRFRPRYFVGYSGEEFEGIALDSDVGRHIFRTWEPGGPLAVADTSADPGVSAELVRATGVRAILSNVLTIRDQPIGGLGFHWLGAAHVFTDDEIDFSRKVTATLALALDNARAYAVEHEIAEALQTNMRSAVESAPGVDIGHLYVPAPGPGRIGGDFYDVFRLEDGRLAFLLGDVSGRGLPAASTNAMARSMVKALAQVDPDPSEVLRRAGETLVRQLKDAEFVTAVFGVLDAETGELCLAMAGHPSPVIAGRPGVCPPDDIRSVPLGIPSRGAPGSWTYRLRPGDTLVLFTDGAYEVRGEDGFFGEERLQAAIAKAASGNSAQDVADGILATVREFSGGDIADDLALLVLTYEGGPVRPAG